jgi:hypothetical protein
VNMTMFHEFCRKRLVTLALFALCWSEGVISGCVSHDRPQHTEPYTLDLFLVEGLASQQTATADSVTTQGGDRLEISDSALSTISVADVEAAMIYCQELGDEHDEGDEGPRKVCEVSLLLSVSAFSRILMSIPDVDTQLLALKTSERFVALAQTITSSRSLVVAVGRLPDSTAFAEQYSSDVSIHDHIPYPPEGPTPSSF